MNKTDIEWCDYTWNPVTGCMHPCEYCYARRLANRFKGEIYPNKVYATENCSLKLYKSTGYGFYENHEIDKPVRNKVGRVVPYPFSFKPTFHRYRLEEPQNLKKSSRIFVVSMGDLFGEWVPDSWIGDVIEACKYARKHTYLFLTKNPKRYHAWGEIFSNNHWLGTSINTQNDISRVDDLIDFYCTGEKFLSIEPLLGEIELPLKSTGVLHRWIDWVIIGAQTGPGAKPPKPEWVQSIIDQCRAAGVPVFLKDNLNWPEKIQEFPEVI